MFTAGAFTDGVDVEEVDPLDDAAWAAKNPVNPATSATPTPASQRVVEEMRRIPLSRSVGRWV